MAEQVDWDALLEKYPSYKVEVEAFLNTVHISRSTDVSMCRVITLFTGPVYP